MAQTLADAAVGMLPVLGELTLGAASGKEHKHALLGILPQGKAWQGKNLRTRVLGAWAEEFARVWHQYVRATAGKQPRHSQRTAARVGALAGYHPCQKGITRPAQLNGRMLVGIRP